MSDEVEKLKEYAKYVRQNVFKFKTETGIGHLASCLSCVDIVVSLYKDKRTLFNHEKDVLLFSKAHGSPSVYPVLAEMGLYDKSELDKYATPEGILRLHSDQSIPGCHFVGGSLGNGIGYGSGVAYANRDSHDVYVILGDAELYEGSVWESLMFIKHHNLTNMKLIVDRNQLGILGKTEEMIKLEPLGEKFASFGFDVYEVDGHDYDALAAVLSKKTKSPQVVIANTIKGKGVKYMEGLWRWHTKIPNTDDLINSGMEDLR